MATSFSGTVRVIVDALLEDTVDIGGVKHTIGYSPMNTLSNGTAANQAKQVFTDRRTLAASGTENIDLSGVLVNAFGAVINFAKIKAIVIVAAAANTNNVHVGGHASAAFVNWVTDATAIIKVKPGGIFLLTAPDANGFAVTATTGDLLTIANSGSGTSVTYDIVLIGTV